jgi:hypothetical protein
MDHEEVYMQPRNIHQQVEHVEVYSKLLFKLANCLQVKAIDVFLTIMFRASPLPYLRLTITSMKRIFF